MLQIRQGIFETNSSSVHALTFFTKDQYDGLVNGDLYYDRWTGKILTEDEALAEGMNEKEFHRMINAGNISEYASEYLGGEGYFGTETTPDGHQVYYMTYFGRD